MTPTRTLAALAAAEPGPTDADLLGRFAAARDDAAFAAVVRRHARMVWAVCRRTAGHHQDAEDAFQATFLVLAKHPAKPRGSAAGFLFGVARRLAARARRTAGLATHPPTDAAGGRDPDPATAAAVRELQAVLDDEVARLPAAYREAFLLCVVGGRSRGRAAAELGVNPGTLSARLARARLALRDRRAKRGVALAAALAVTDLSQAAVPPALADAAATAGAAAWGGRGAANWATAAAGLVLLAAVAVGLTPGSAQPPAASPPAVPAAAPPDEPLPAGAAARLGSTRWRHPGDATSLSFSPDGAVLAALSAPDGGHARQFLTLFDAATGRVFVRQTRPDTRAVVFSPDGSALAELRADGTTDLRHPRTLALLRSLAPAGVGHVPDHSAPAAFSPDGKRLAALTGPDDVTTVWDVPGGRVVATVTGYNHANPSMAFDGSALLLGLSRAEGKSDVQVWDATAGKKLRGFDPGVAAWSLAVSAGGVVASGGDDAVVLSDLRTGKQLARFPVPERTCHIALTPDGKTVVTDHGETRVRVWDAATGKLRHTLDGRGWMSRSMAVSADGRRVAVGGVYNIVRVWDVATGREVAAADDGHDAPVRSVAVTPDGKTVVTGGANHHLRTWDAATGRPLRRLAASSSSQISFSPDGARLVTAWENGGAARVWNAARGEKLAELAPKTEDKTPLAAFTPDGKAVVTASWRAAAGENFGRTVLRTWDGATWKATRELQLKGLQPGALAVSPDGRWAAVGGAAGNGTGPGASLRWWDLARDRERAGAEGTYLVAAAFSPDGRLLVTGGIDRKARLWEAATGREVLALGGHERSVAAVGFTPDGRVVVTADGGPVSVYWGEKFGPPSVRFWDAATGRELARLAGHGVDATALAVTTDGRRVLTGLADGTTLVWDVPAAAAPPRPVPGGRAPAALWTDLGSDDAPTAYAAVQALAADPDRAVPYLRQALRPVPPADAARLRRQIADLGSLTFATREAASAALADAGEEAEAELTRALAATDSPEVRRRLAVVVARLDGLASPDRRREVRAVWALERAGTPAARAALTDLAAGASAARLTREAAAALSRR